MTDNQQNITSERINVGGKEYIKPSGSRMLSDEIKKSAGSFINILANKLSVEAPAGKIVSYRG